MEDVFVYAGCWVPRIEYELIYILLEPALIQSYKQVLESIFDDSIPAEYFWDVSEAYDRLKRIQVHAIHALKDWDKVLDDED